MRLERSDRSRYEEARGLLDAGQPSDAYVIYEELARAGDANSQVFVGWMSYAGHGVEKDEALGLEWFQKAASIGSAPGAFYCGRHAAKGGQYDEALRYFHQAARADYSPALFWLGLCNDRGYGVPINKKKAEEYLRRAATGGNLFARRALAVKMIKGELGLLNVPLGLLLFPYAALAAVLDGLTKGYTERLIA